MRPNHVLNTGLTQFNPNFFPSTAFPMVMAGAIHDVANRTKAPIPLVASSVLSASALACQRDYQVRLPYGALRPLSLYLLLVANSGERKSAADGLVYDVVRQLEKAHRTDFLEKSEMYRQQIASWTAFDKALQRRIARAKGDQMSELQRKLEEHHSHKPVEPSERRYILDDTTPAGIIGGLRKSSSVSLVSNDGRTMLMGRALSDVSLINRAWECEPLRVDRAGGETFLLDNYRLSLWPMVQPGVLDEFKNHDRGRVSRETGLLARCLVAYPQSTQGSRFFDPKAIQPRAGLQEFHERLQDILTSSSTRQVVEVDDGATEVWTRFHNNLEQDLAPGGYLADVADFASKAPENAARIAAIFHVMSGRAGPLNADYMTNACDLTEWYLHEAKRLFGAPLISLEEADADSLSKWLEGQLSQLPRGALWIDLPKAYIYHRGPNALRTRNRLDPALQILEFQGRVNQFRSGKKIFYRYIRGTSF